MELIKDRPTKADNSYRVAWYETEGGLRVPYYYDPEAKPNTHGHMGHFGCVMTPMED